MDGGNLLFDLQQESARRNGKRNRAFPAQRRSAVREKLMVLLTEPRTVKDIAVGASRTSSNITGHLRAMRQKNLVVRLSWGV
jgi:predicted transcriptional regulator